MNQTITDYFPRRLFRSDFPKTRKVLIFAIGILTGVALQFYYPMIRKAPSVSEKQKLAYSTYLNEIMRTLRTERSVRMWNLSLPYTILRYQRTPASIRDKGLVLAPKRAEVPFIAVSRKAMRFLTLMNVAYVDPTKLPDSMVPKASLPFDSDSLKDYLLIPDTTGDHGSAFRLVRNLNSPR